jgi:hypothetical protein
MSNDSDLNITPSHYANQRVKFLGSDARLTLIYVIIWLLTKSWIILGMFILTLSVSIFMEMNDIDFMNYIKKIRLKLSGKVKRKTIKNTY